MNYITRHEQGILIHTSEVHIHNTSINVFLHQLCTLYLSTLDGRRTATKRILNDCYLIPFVVHETILLFPTHAHRNPNNHYINFHTILQLKNHQAKTRIVFYDGTDVVVDRPLHIVKNQYRKAKTLWEYYECAKQKESVYIGVFPLDFLR